MILGIGPCDTANCDNNAVCMETGESYECVCRTGYTDNGTSCEGNISAKEALGIYYCGILQISMSVVLWTTVQKMPFATTLPGVLYVHAGMDTLVMGYSAVEVANKELFVVIIVMAVSQQPMCFLHVCLCRMYSACQ